MLRRLLETCVGFLPRDTMHKRGYSRHAVSVDSRARQAILKVNWRVCRSFCVCVCVCVCEQPKLHFASADFDETRYVGPSRVQVCRFADSATSAPLRRNYQRKTSVAFRYECTYRSYALRRSTSSSSRLQHACHTPRRQLLRCELTSSRIMSRLPACLSVCRSVTFVNSVKTSRHI